MLRLTICGLFSVILSTQAQDYQCGPTDLWTIWDVNISSSQILNFHSIPHCQWVITASSRNHGVYLQIANSSTLQSCPDCSCQSLTAYDGDTADSEVLTTFCGPGEHPSILSSERFLTLVYRSNLDVNNGDFMVQASQRYVPCEQNLRASEDTKTLLLTGMRRGFTCTWNIRAEEDKRIRLRVLEADVDSCNLNIYEEIQMAPSNLIGTLCGPNETFYRSYNNEMAVAFLSHLGPVPTSRVRLEFSAYTPPPFERKHTTLRAYDFEMMLTSQNFPHNYPERTVETWLIQAYSDYVCVTSHNMQLQYSTNCGRDYLQLFDGSHESDTSLGRWCGTEEFRKCSTGHTLFIRFYSDNSRTARGFKLGYKIYKHDETSPHFQNTTIWICVGILSAVCMIAVAVCAAILRKKKIPRAPNVCTDAMNQTYMMSMIPVSPPSYDDAIKTENPNPPAYEEPPSYETLDVDTLNANTAPVTGVTNSPENPE